jgi:hypothetical protein
MTVMFFAGVALALLGLAGILWFILRVKRLKDVKENDASIQAELRSLVLLNTASVGLAFLGLAVAVVGLIMG